MSDAMKKKPNIRITVVDRLGPKGCHRGMRKGMSFDWDTQRGELCPMVSHIAFPYVDILRYGGSFGKDNPYQTRFCCSDPDTVTVFKIELIKDEQDN